MISKGSALLPIGLAPGAFWLSGYATHQTLQFTEDPERIDAGTYYKPTLTGFVPANSSDLIDLMESMEQERFLVALTDAKGQKTLLGTPGSPMIFTSKFDGSATRAGSKGYTFEFAGTTYNRAPVYSF